MSQAELALKAGVSRTTIANLEAGRRAQSMVLRQIADAPGVEPGDLVGDLPERQTRKAAD